MTNETITYKQIDKVCEIRVVDKRKTDYQYREKYIEKYWFRKPIIHKDVFITVSGGYEGGTYVNIYTREQILGYKRQDGTPTYLIEENIVYDKPYVYVKFDSKYIDGHCKYFNTFEEAKLWAEDFVSKNNFNQKLIKF